MDFLELHNPANPQFSCKKAIEKPKTDEKDDTKWIFMELPYTNDINGRIPK